MTEYLHTYGVYIRRLTAKLFAKANGLPAEVLREDRGAFFISDFSLFNHQTMPFQAGIVPGSSELPVTMEGEPCIPGIL
ncbi:MAG: hypothetical protein AUJ57_04750 [Zetaproteobacteria bacterium CG1_02_53_45]|nr:MAG: hypothetical protein AUJ57_04750 [Zetaproteobacteria bacterium CG1_02_53_45]